MAGVLSFSDVLPRHSRAWYHIGMKAPGTHTDLLLEQRKERARAELRAFVQEGLDSGEPIPVTDEFWEDALRKARGA